MESLVEQTTVVKWHQLDDWWVSSGRSSQTPLRLPAFQKNRAISGTDTPRYTEEIRA
jgi:hypothetical protein